MNFGVRLWFVKRTSQDHDHHYLHLFLILLLLLLLLEKYNPMRTFAFDAIILHSFQSLTPVCQLRITTVF